MEEYQKVFSTLALTDEQKAAIEEAAILGFNLEEAADYVMLNKDLIEPFFKRGVLMKKAILLGLQWKKAKEMDTAMLIHLGKAMINQNEKIINEHTIETIPFEGLTRQQLLDRMKELEDE